jgi:NADPH:quinone reductase-like Zn-dependent oxidoreductase
MKAIRIGRTGGPEVLDYVDLPTPEPGPGEVLVRADARRAHELLEQREAMGKIVLRP